MWDYNNELKEGYNKLADIHHTYEESSNKTAQICYEILQDIHNEKGRNNPKYLFLEERLIKEFNVNVFIDSLWSLSFLEKTQKIQKEIDKLQNIINELREIQKNNINTEIQYQFFIKSYWIPFYSFWTSDGSIYQNIFNDRIDHLTNKENNIEQRTKELWNKIYFLKETLEKLNNDYLFTDFS